jgi:hypothetical protein
MAVQIDPSPNAPESARTKSRLDQFEDADPETQRALEAASGGFDWGSLVQSARQAVPILLSLL